MWLLLLLLTSAPASAAIVYSGIQNIAVPFTFSGVYVNIVTTDDQTSEPANWTTEPWLNPFFGGTAIASNSLLRPLIAGPDRVVNVANGTFITSGNTFATDYNGSETHVGPAGDQFEIGVLGLVGFQFESTIGGATKFGWMSLTTDNLGNGLITDWAYNDEAGVGIVAGQLLAVPEPSRALLLVLGACGFVLRRRPM